MIASLSAQEKIRRILVNDLHQIDQNMPRWARRRHPIVKRELGLYWRIMPPQIETPLKAFWIQAVVVLATIPIPFLMTLLLPLVLVSFAMLPVALYMFARMLYDLAADTSRSMVSEIENHTLGVLMTTPVSVREMLLSKLAGALWKQSEPFSVILTVASMTQIPSIFILYANAFPPQDYPGVAQVISVVMLALSLLRLPIEAFMVAALGQFVGLTTTGRGAAQAASIGLTGFYFLLVNLPRLLVLDPFWRVMVDGVLPSIAAAGTVWLLLRLTVNHLTYGDRA